MPRRGDLTSVLVIGPGREAGSGRAGAAACRVLRAEGLRVAVVVGGSASTMADPDLADATYVEPVTPETVEEVIARERPDALLPAFGGRTAFDTAVALHGSGVLARYGVELIGVELIGADLDAARPDDGSGRGRREVELALVCDRHGAAMVVGSVEHFGPVSVAPAMTLTGADERWMCEVASAVVRGAAAGGRVVRFAVEPRTSRPVVVGVAARVSRSGVLAAGAAGFPIAEVVTRLALGYPLDEVAPVAPVAPVGDRVVVEASGAVGVGRSFPEALNKALRSSPGGPLSWAEPVGDVAALVQAARVAGGRVDVVHRAVRAGADIAELAAATGLDPWLLGRVRRVEEVAREVAAQVGALRPETVVLAKEHGLSDAQIGQLRHLTEDEVRELRRALGLLPHRPVPSGTAPRVVVLGPDAGSDDTCALAEAGYEVVVVDPGPEAVPAGHRAYREPITVETVLDVVAAEGAARVLVSGRAPLGLAARLRAAGVSVLGVGPGAVAGSFP
ncbi:MAG: hypothetical protein HOV94_10055, partial [Saccharothrix sp.]|nr:hypothetical protein [Saccharothrix sp.]